MRKLAVFVEGQTEALFIVRLVERIASRNQVRIEHWKASGGRGVPRLRKLVGRSRDTGQEFLLLLVDCAGDSRVASDVRDNYESLVRSGYSGIVALRDVYPSVAFSEIPKLRRGLAFGIRTKPIPVTFVLSIMEIEAWFIAEHTHFTRIDPGLTLERIQAALGFRPDRDPVELRRRPAQDLDAIYRLAGMRYKKDWQKLERTVDALDYARVYAILRSRIPDLRCLLEVLDRFLAPEAADM